MQAAILEIILGGGAMAASTLGVDATAVASFMAIVAFAAMATPAQMDAALAGALGGMVAGLFADAPGDPEVAKGALTDVVMGALVGAIAGYSASGIAEATPHPRSAAMAGAGAGVAAASLITVQALSVAYSVVDLRGGADALDATAISVFLVVWVALPLTNAVVDYLSLGVSHVLGTMALRSGRTVPCATVLVLLDIAAALGLMVATTVLIAVGLSLADMFDPFSLDPAGFFADAAADPFQAELWFSMMVLSTLTWTVLHCAFVAAPAAAALASSALLHVRLVTLR